MAPEYLDHRTLSGGIVNLTVGPSETPFDVHIELLCDRSPYFDNLLENRYTEISLQELVFPDDVPEVFADFISWVYCGKISGARIARKLSRSLHLFQLWTLAERFQVPELQDIAFAICKELLDAEPAKVVGSEAVQHAYSHSSPGSSIRQLAVDMWAARASDFKILRSRMNLPSEFIADLNATRLRTQKLFAFEVYMLHPVTNHDDRLCTFVTNLNYAKAEKDTPDTPFSVAPISKQSEPTISDDSPRRASAAQLAHNKDKALSSWRRDPDQISRLPPQVLIFTTPVSRALAPSASRLPRSGRRKVRVKLPPSTDPSYTKFSTKSILGELYRIENNGEKV